MIERYVLGIDPGPSKFGWAVVSSTGQVVNAGLSDASRHSVEDFFRTRTHRNSSVTRVVIEAVEGVVFQPWRTKFLWDTARVEERIGAAAQRSDLGVMTVSARTWRKRLLLNAASSDGDIKRYVESNLILAKTYPNNAHTRDAMCIATYGIHHWQEQAA